MQEDNSPVNYSAADIEKYWTGQLSASEQHAMEKAAQEDPFLADAMEGYENRSRLPQVVSADIQDVKERLAARTAEKKKGAVVGFAWWKAAAVIIIMAGVGWLYTGISNKSKEQHIAKQETVANKKVQAPAAADSGTTNADTTATANALQDLAVNKPRKQPRENNAVATPEKENDIKPAAPVASTSKEGEERKEEKTTFAKTDTLKEEHVKAAPLKKDLPATTSPAAEQRAQGIATDDYKAGDKALAGRVGYTANNTFNGNVTDQQNKPVPNAFIQIPRLNVATQTDNQGYFSFKAQDTSLSVSVESNGFITQNLQLRNKATLNQIVLKPAPPSQRDVVVQSNGAEKRKRSAMQEITIKIPDAEPVVGWDAYKEYLEKNKKINSDVQDIHGTVVVSFDVHQKWIGNYMIEQSLDEQLDAEAIRLIKQGPAWKLLKGKKTTATVIVKF